MKTEQALSRIRVADFGQYVAGPAAAMMLGDLGAEVIRVDPPGGPRWDSPAAAMLNRGKTCVELDLKSASGAARAREIIRSSDVLIENFRPGVMDRLGLGATAIRREYPALVYLSLPGFSSRDGKRAPILAWEAIIAASCGQYSDMGLNRVLMGIEPSFSPLPLASAYGAVLGAAAVTLALNHRLLTGRGDTIEVPLAAALMEGLAYNAQRVENYPDRYKSNREREIERRRAHDLPMDATYDELQELLDPFYRNYRCADGRMFYVVSGSHRNHPERVLKILGLWDELVAEGLPRHDAYLDTSDWPQGADCTLYNYPLSPRWAARISALMKRAFMTKSAREWERIFGEAGAPAAAQRTTAEWLRSEHANRSGLILRVADPDYGDMSQLGNVAWLRSDADATDKSTRRRVDAGALAWAPAREGDDGTAGGGWLDGLRVLDLTNVIAGPTIASTLARFGAEVISVDPVAPTMDPWNAIVFGMHAGRGKRSLLMDLKSQDTRPAFERLLKWADVVTANATDDQLRRIGLDPAGITDSYPGLILCQLDCYGGPRPGPRSEYPGYDDLVQASTGIMARFGGSLETPEEHAHFGTIDVLGGFCGVLATAAALYRRSVCGAGDVARTSLCAAGQLIQAPFMYDFEGRPPFDEPSGRSTLGWGPAYRAYAASDGWFFLAARSDRLEQLCTIAGIGYDSGGPETKLEAALENAFAARPLEYWPPRLSRADFGACRIDKMHAVRDRHLVAESKAKPDLSGPTFTFVRHDGHPGGRWVDLVAPNAIRPLEAALRIPQAAPKPGRHSREILLDVGLTSDEVDDLLASGAVGIEWSRKYLPE